MKQHQTPPNCVFCGRFVGWRRGWVSWIPYGSYNDFEPPDTEFAHEECWNKQDDNMKELIYRTSWGKPTIE